ncbi:acyltransferase [Clostridium sulfidigenes]|uniref:Acyltransferase n=1 Tax=Clostridium sulfidigenes TaxID=318464 RepID=A0A084JIM4_9CLOT|nr:GNAT family protein [Clostridium sulfidigenes]KEZ88808.1 acyltransferase [Clostridium sulfidigenes]
MNILGKYVTLRAIEEKDLELLHKWANDPKTQDAMGIIHFPSSMDFHKRWYDNLKSDTLNQRLAIEAPEIGLIGLSSIINIDWRNNHAWHGVMLGDTAIRGKGYGIDSVMATMRYAFEEMHLERLDGSIIEYNERSYNFYCGEKLGWKKEGCKKKYYFRRGKYWDQIIVGITREDYYNLIEKTGYWEK